jgi:type VI secretion system FHA domain protein
VSVPASAPAPAAAPARPAPPVAPSAPPRPALAGDPARAFFQGAGAEDVVIPDAELAATMHRLGEVVRILIEGLRDVLMTRASIKTEFRMERTQISAKGNNPLKFALSGEHAVEMILRPKAKGYMDSGAAVKEAIEDIKAHEVAMVTGMQAAIRDVLSKLDPKAVEARAGSGGGLAVLGGRKARLWDEYEKLFAQVSEQAENDFHEFFSREFARAYQEQLGKLK